MSSISLRGISKQFGSTQVLDRLDLEVADGEFLVLLGPSGCGKTTLLRILAGLTAPTSGRVFIDTVDVTEMSSRHRDIAMVFQSYALYPHLTVARNLGFGLSVRRRPAEQINRAVRDVAEQLGLTTLLDRRPRELSGGQRQRVAVGRAMVRDPKVFLMDEPLSNLDAQLRNATRLELSGLHRTLGTTFVYVTHDQVEAMTMGTKIAVLNKGRLEQFGTPSEIYNEPASSFVAGFMGAPPMNLIDVRLTTHEGRIHAVADGVDAALWEGALPEREVRLGVRPEHLELVAANSDRAVMRGRVTAVENLGSEEVAFVLVGGRSVAIRGRSPLGAGVGENVAMGAPTNRLYLFSIQTTRRLTWIDDEPEESGEPGEPEVADRNNQLTAHR
ncbi:ABC transporter ATP-binding protein [soil metagenome]